MTQLLNLPEVLVESSLQEGQVLILSVGKKAKSASCPHCGQNSRHLHQNQKCLVKDLPMGDFEVILNVNRRRFKCKKYRKAEIYDIQALVAYFLHGLSWSNHHYQGEKSDNLLPKI